MASSTPDEKSQRLSCENRIGSSSTLAVSLSFYIPVCLWADNMSCTDGIATLKLKCSVCLGQDPNTTQMETFL